MLQSESASLSPSFGRCPRFLTKTGGWHRQPAAALKAVQEWARDAQVISASRVLAGEAAGRQATERYCSQHRSAQCAKWFIGIRDEDWTCASCAASRSKKAVPVRHKRRSAAGNGGLAVVQRPLVVGDEEGEDGGVRGGTLSALPPAREPPAAAEDERKPSLPPRLERGDSDTDEDDVEGSDRQMFERAKPSSTTPSPGMAPSQIDACVLCGHDYGGRVRISRRVGKLACVPGVVCEFCAGRAGKMLVRVSGEGDFPTAVAE